MLQTDFRHREYGRGFNDGEEHARLRDAAISIANAVGFLPTPELTDTDLHELLLVVQGKVAEVEQLTEDLAYARNELHDLGVKRGEVEARGGRTMRPRRQG